MQIIDFHSFEIVFQCWFGRYVTVDVCILFIWKVDFVEQVWCHGVSSHWQSSQSFKQQLIWTKTIEHELNQPILSQTIWNEDDINWQIEQSAIIWIITWTWTELRTSFFEYFLKIIWFVILSKQEIKWFLRSSRMLYITIFYLCLSESFWQLNVLLKVLYDLNFPFLVFVLRLNCFLSRNFLEFCHHFKKRVIMFLLWILKNILNWLKRLKLERQKSCSWITKWMNCPLMFLWFLFTFNWSFESLSFPFLLKIEMSLKDWINWICFFFLLNWLWDLPTI